MTNSLTTRGRVVRHIWPAGMGARGYDAMEFAPHECHRDFPEQGRNFPEALESAARPDGARGGEAPIRDPAVRGPLGRHRPGHHAHGPDPERRLLREVDAALGGRERRFDRDPMDSRPWDEDPGEEKKGPDGAVSRLYRD